MPTIEELEQQLRDARNTQRERMTEVARQVKEAWLAKDRPYTVTAQKRRDWVYPDITLNGVYICREVEMDGKIGGMFYYRTDENILTYEGGGYHLLDRTPRLCSDAEWESILVGNIPAKFLPKRA